MLSEIVFNCDSMGLGIIVAYFRIDENLSMLVADIGIMHKNTTSTHLVFLYGIGNGNL